MLSFADLGEKKKGEVVLCPRDKLGQCLHLKIQEEAIAETLMLTLQA